jgi:tetratricopeptide (TPR) repeat protein
VTSTPRTGATTLWIGLALFGLIAAVYAPVRHHAFLNYDDNEYVTENPHVTVGLTRDSFMWAWTSPHSATWHPLTTLSHLLDCQLFGLEPGAPHVVNAVVHALSGVLLFLVFARMTAQPWRSACAAALFALHPMRVESVAWIAERKDVLSTFFWILTMWTYAAYAQRRGVLRYALLLLSYLAALLSKPMVVTLPFVLLLLDGWPLRRITSPENAVLVGATGRLPLRTLLIEKLPLLVLAAVVSAITVVNQWNAGAMVGLQRLSLADRFANALISYVAYLGKMLWPSRLAVIYPYEEPIPTWRIAGAAVLLVVLTALALWQRRGHPYLLVGWLWYLGTLVPVSGVFQAGSHAMADRFTYVPSIGIVLIAAWGIPDLLRRWPHGQAACAAAAASAIAAYTLVTAVQLRHWRDSVSLFRYALSVTHDNAVAETHLGMALVALGQRDDGARHIAAGDRITREVEARHYAEVLRRDPGAADAHVKLARLLAEGGDVDGAVAHYREAIRLVPNAASPHNNLAVVLEGAGQIDAAIAEYQEGVRLEPRRAQARSNLAAALLNAGRPREAIAQFRVALEIEPQWLDARFGLASAYARAGEAQPAAAALDELLRARPDWIAVEAALAWVLATTEDAAVRNGARAVQLAEDAARRSGQRDADVLDSLAAAYAEAGRFPEAVDTAERAVALARATGRTALVVASAQRMARYRAGLPYREPATSLESQP